MDNPIWIGLDLTLAIHRRQLAEHRGLDGVRDQGMLESALARPRQQIAILRKLAEAEIAALAGAYALGIARNHPFVDGNKCTAYVVCRTFLVLNGFDLTAPREERYVTFLQLAAGEISEDELIGWLKENCRIV